MAGGGERGPRERAAEKKEQSAEQELREIQVVAFSHVVLRKRAFWNQATDSRYPRDARKVAALKNALFLSGFGHPMLIQPLSQPVISVPPLAASVAALTDSPPAFARARPDFTSGRPEFRVLDP